MPELPDIDLYVEKLQERIGGRTLLDVQVQSPFLLRSYDPPLTEVQGKKVESLRRVGKRIAIGLQDDLWLVIHLMVLGRLQWAGDQRRPAKRHQLAAFAFDSGTLLLSESGSRKQASLHLVCGVDAWREHDPGGLEPLDCSCDQFQERLLAENRTLKRALTNPRSFSGIGNAYSDEILHAARLSPLQLTRNLTVPESRRLYDATREVLINWRDRLRTLSGNQFPAKVTAFHKAMSVHGKFGKPCPACGGTVQRIRYQRTETNYCPACQTGGRILADRSLSRLLKDGWPE